MNNEIKNNSAVKSDETPSDPKLSLKKKTIRELDLWELENVIGGAGTANRSGQGRTSRS